jgi:hypothetical protein
MVKVTLYSYSRDIAKVDQEQSKISPCNSALLVLYSGSGLQRTQQSYNSHLHDLPHGPEHREHSQIDIVYAPRLHNFYHPPLDHRNERYTNKGINTKLLQLY